MLLVDDQRRCVDANDAACLFLRLPRDAVRALWIDDLIDAELRDDIEALWHRFLASGTSPRSRPARPWRLRMPDGTRVTVDVSGTPHFRPGRHLGIFRFPAARQLDAPLDRDAEGATNSVLTKRERQVLTRVALGDTGLQIADQLCISPATVATHVTNALIKLRAKNRAHGIAIALQTEELTLAPPRSSPMRSARPSVTPTAVARVALESDDPAVDAGATAARTANT